MAPLLCINLAIEMQRRICRCMHH